MLYSCSWPDYIRTIPATVNYTNTAAHCNIWRMYNDVQDSWESVTGIVDWVGDNVRARAATLISVRQRRLQRLCGAAMAADRTAVKVLTVSKNLKYQQICICGAAGGHFGAAVEKHWRPP
jgi:hypothetical protein